MNIKKYIRSELEIDKVYLKNLIYSINYWLKNHKNVPTFVGIVIKSACKNYIKSLLKDDAHEAKYEILYVDIYTLMIYAEQILNYKEEPKGWLYG